MSSIVWGVAVFIVLAGIYLVLAGNVDGFELALAAICAALGTTLIIAIEAVAKRHYDPRPPLRALLHPFAALLPELVIVGLELLSVILAPAGRKRGTFILQPFEPGNDSPREAARRALTIFGVSLAPRSFVIRGEQTDELVLHTLPPKGASDDTMWPT